jgi:hypothetical protein
MSIIQLPTGMQLGIRSWNLGDIKHLSETKQSNILRGMFLRAVTSIENPGPYSNIRTKDDLAKNVDGMLFSDITAALVQIRAKSSNEFEFRQPCEYCAHVNQLTLDLNEHEIYQASEEAIAHITTGKPIQMQVSSILVELKLLRLADFTIIARESKKNKQSILDLQVAMCVSKLVDGETVCASLGQVRDYLDRFDFSLINELKNTIDELEGGPEMSVAFDCANPDCRREQEAAFPFDGNFFFPGAEKTKKKSKRRSLVPKSVE